MSRNAYIQFDCNSLNEKLEVTSYDYLCIQGDMIHFYTEHFDEDCLIASVNMNNIDCIQYEEADDS